MLQSNEKLRFGKIVPAYEPLPFVHDQAEGLRRLVKQSGRAARVLAVTSGKGGVGKTNVSINLAIALAAMKKRVIIVDLDLGLANCDIILDLMPRYNLSHVIAGKKTLDDVILQAPGGIQMVPGASGVGKLADMAEAERNALLVTLSQLQERADYIIFDTGAGISRNTISFLAAADEVLLVTIPEPTAIIDAYAVVKMLSKEEDCGDIRLILNMARGLAETERISNGIIETANKILNVYVNKLGYIVADDAVPASVRKKRPFSILYPHSAAVQCVRRIAENICRSHKENVDVERPGFIRRLLSVFHSM